MVLRRVITIAAGVAVAAAAVVALVLPASAQAGLTLDKRTNGQLAPIAPGPLITVGDPVEWTYLITNSGTTPLTTVTLTDDQLAAGDINCGDGTNVIDQLASGASATCTASGTAAAGQYTNTATVTGATEGEQPTATATSHYFGIQPSITLEKTTNGQSPAAPTGPQVPVGDPVNWAYMVTNTGNINLTGLAVVDDQGVTVTCPATTLAVGANVTCTASGTAAAGQYSNTGTATALAPATVAPDGSTVPGEQVGASDPSFYFGVTTGIDLVKKTNTVLAPNEPGPYVPVGGPVTWTFDVTNTGNTEMTNVTVTDDLVPTADIDCGAGNNVIATLAAGATTTCTATGTAVAGQHVNNATVTGTVDGQTVTDTSVSHYFGIEPSIQVEKLTNGMDVPAAPGPLLIVGASVTWTYNVTNTGNVPLTGVAVVDDQGVTVTCPGTTLAPAASMPCTASGTVKSGAYHNVGTATGTAPDTTAPDGTVTPGIDVTDNDDSFYFGATPGIDLVKKTNTVSAPTEPGPYVPVGGPVTWTYAVTNTGNSVMTNVTVTDDLVPTADIDCGAGNNVIATLAAGATTTCTATGTAVAGQHVNNATATGTVDGSTVTDTDISHYFGSEPSIELEKLTNGMDVTAPPGPSLPVGDPVTWTYNVTNTGNVPLTGVAVVDDQGVTVTCPGTTLDPGASMACTASGTVQSGQYHNVGTATGTAPDTTAPDGTVTPGVDVTDDDESWYTGAGEPGIEIVKKVNGEDANDPPGPTVPVGSTLEFTYEVTNTGAVELTDIVVTDDQGLDVTCPSTTLAPAEMMTCTAESEATEGPCLNTGTVTAKAGDTDVSDSDVAQYTGEKADEPCQDDGDHHDDGHHHDDGDHHDRHHKKSRHHHDSHDDDSHDDDSHDGGWQD